jgi:hypothetical protein
MRSMIIMLTFLTACGDKEEVEDTQSNDTDNQIVDADEDGVAAADDCDDNDAASTTVATDADCDGILTADDCDDADAASTTVATDADCDAVLTDDDCDDTDETITTTNTSDSDCDGVVNADDWAPNDPTETADSDEDGLGDNQEGTLGTNPQDSDSDGDGLSDGDEVNTHLTDPKNVDSDGDGSTDKQEIDGGTDPNDPTEGIVATVIPDAGTWAMSNSSIDSTSDICGLETTLSAPPYSINLLDYLPSEFGIENPDSTDNTFDINLEGEVASCDVYGNSFFCESVSVQEPLDLSVVLPTLGTVDLVFAFELNGSLTDTSTMNARFATMAKDCFDTDSDGDLVLDSAASPGTCSLALSVLQIELPCELDLDSDANKQ